MGFGARPDLLDGRALAHTLLTDIKYSIISLPKGSHDKTALGASPCCLLSDTCRLEDFRDRCSSRGDELKRGGRITIRLGPITAQPHRGVQGHSGQQGQSEDATEAPFGEGDCRRAKAPHGHSQRNLFLCLETRPGSDADPLSLRAPGIPHPSGTLPTGWPVNRPPVWRDQRRQMSPHSADGLGGRRAAAVGTSDQPTTWSWVALMRSHTGVSTVSASDSGPRRVARRALKSQCAKRRMLHWYLTLAQTLSGKRAGGNRLSST